GPSELGPAVRRVPRVPGRSGRADRRGPPLAHRHRGEGPPRARIPSGAGPGPLGSGPHRSGPRRGRPPRRRTAPGRGDAPARIPWLLYRDGRPPRLPGRAHRAPGPPMSPSRTPPAAPPPAPRLPGRFDLATDLVPQGDQPAAIEEIVRRVARGEKFVTLLGVTGSGKTFTMAHTVARLQRPTLVVSPNKTLAAQLVSEFRALFPTSAVEYFVSYYDYYQPEAYVPQIDLYIEKDAAINEEI